MTQCKCEHWQQCPVCMPHRFDAEGKLLPPEPTPLQSARTRIAELEAIIEAQRTLYANASKIANESDELRRQQAVLVEALEESQATMRQWRDYNFHPHCFPENFNRTQLALRKVTEALASVNGNSKVSGGGLPPSG